MPRIQNPPIWAGVVVRLEDGTTYAIQIAHPINATFTRQMDVADRFGDWREPVASGPVRVHIEIDGYEGQWDHRANIPTPDEIEPTRKAIER
jgi:hypothetical protein